MPTDLGERGCDLGKPESVTAKPLRHAEGDHTAIDERLPAVVPAERGSHHVGDGLLPFVWAEVHPNPP